VTDTIARTTVEDPNDLPTFDEVARSSAVTRLLQRAGQCCEAEGAFLALPLPDGRFQPVAAVRRVPPRSGEGAPDAETVRQVAREPWPDPALVEALEASLERLEELTGDEVIVGSPTSADAGRVFAAPLLRGGAGGSVAGLLAVADPPRSFLRLEEVRELTALARRMLAHLDTLPRQAPPVEPSLEAPSEASTARPEPSGMASGGPEATVQPSEAPLEPSASSEVQATVAEASVSSLERSCAASEAAGGAAEASTIPGELATRAPEHEETTPALEARAVQSGTLEAAALSTLIELSRDAVLLADAEGWLMAMNAAALELHGLSGSLLGERGMAEAERLLRARSSPVLDDDGPLEQARGGARVHTELDVVGADGMVRRIEVRAAPVVVGTVLGAVAVLADVTDRHSLDESRTEAARRDPVTGLETERVLFERLELALERSGRDGTSVGLVLITLEGLQMIRDLYGQEVEDRFLYTVARRLRSELRPSDTAVRLAADRFVFVVGPPMEAEQLHAIERRLAASASEPVRIGDRDVSASVRSASTVADTTRLKRPSLLLEELGRAG
jgi:diguanylate cyclase (GGDEF)-like protein/PAS domain S-box-containing protein